MFRRRIGDVFVVAEQQDDGSWRVDVTDAASRPVDQKQRAAALTAVLGELSSLRAHIWHEELGNPRRADLPPPEDGQ